MMEVGSTKKEKKEHQCAECGLSFTSRYCLLEHTTVQHRDLTTCELDEITLIIRGLALRYGVINRPIASNKA